MQAFIEFWFGVLHQVKLFHWATTSYSEHIALDGLHTALAPKIDTLVETFIGRTRAQPLGKFSVKTTSTSDTKKVFVYLEATRDEIVKMVREQESDYPEIANILQDIASDFNQAIYLCNLKK